MSRTACNVAPLTSKLETKIHLSARHYCKLLSSQQPKPSNAVESIHGGLTNAVLHDLMRSSCCHRAWKSSSKKVSPCNAGIERSLDLNGTNWKQFQRLQCISKSLELIIATFFLSHPQAQLSAIHHLCVKRPDKKLPRRCYCCAWQSVP